MAQSIQPGPFELSMFHCFLKVPSSEYHTIRLLHKLQSNV